MCRVSVTPSDAGGLGRTPLASSPASQKAKRLRFGRHRVTSFPHHCRPQGFPLPSLAGQGNRTRGGGRRHNAGGASRQTERIKIMTCKSTQAATKTPTPRARPERQTITFELVTRLAPHQGLADNLVRTFDLEPVDYDTIRDATAEHIARAAKAFETALNEKALQIHLQRITGAFVGSAVSLRGRPPCRDA